MAKPRRRNNQGLVIVSNERTVHVNVTGKTHLGAQYVRGHIEEGRPLCRVVLAVLDGDLDGATQRGGELSEAICQQLILASVELRRRSGVSPSHKVLETAWGAGDVHGGVWYDLLDSTRNHC